MIKTTDKYAIFYTEWPSNFCTTHFKWSVFGEEHDFFCTEQAFMWAKAKHFGDEETAKAILSEDSDPMTCKSLGRMVRHYNDQEWDKVRYDYMLKVNIEKYLQDELLQKKILDPKFDGKTFVEASPTDRIWGVGLGQSDPRIEDSKNWRGQNLLGKVLTEARAEIINRLSKAASLRESKDDEH